MTQQTDPLPPSFQKGDARKSALLYLYVQCSGRLVPNAKPMSANWKVETTSQPKREHAISMAEERWQEATLTQLVTLGEFKLSNYMGPDLSSSNREVQFTYSQLDR